MADSTFYERLSKIIKDKHLSQDEAAKISGVSQTTISRVIKGGTDKKYCDYDNYINLCSTDEQKYYLATGEHLPDNTTTENDINKEMLDTVKNLTVLVGSLIKEMYELKEEIKGLKCIKEVSESAQVRLPQKIPEHH